jgi:hypothetical protein
MAVNEVVRSAANVEADMDNARNPVIETTGGSRNRKIVHVTLVLENYDLDPSDLYDALETLGVTTFGEDLTVVTPEVTIAGEKSTHERGTYIFNVGPV